jgi:hypothetical protein
MQPYIFPYLGYFQLMQMVDRFVLLDDVNFIKKGWINRNQILLNGEPRLFTIPIRGASQNKFICELALAPDDGWRKKLLLTLRQAYVGAPFYSAIEELIGPLIDNTVENLDQFLYDSLSAVARYVGIGTHVVKTSRAYEVAHLKGQDRILRICQRENAKQYVNPIGGQDLYESGVFQQSGIELLFLRPRLSAYPQGGLGAREAFVPGLSILDALMFNAPEDILHMLNEAEPV